MAIEDLNDAREYELFIAREYELFIDDKLLGFVNDSNLGTVTLNGAVVDMSVKELADRINGCYEPTKPINPELMTEPEFQEMRYGKEQ